MSPRGPCGPEARPTSYVCVRRMSALTSRGAHHGQKIRGRLRRAQTFPRALGIEITFSPEGRTGTRNIRMSTSAENTVSTVSMVSAVRSRESRGDQAILAEVRK